MILAGDVGGTKVHLGLYQFRQGQLEHIRDQKFAAQNYANLQEIVKEFLGVSNGETRQEDKVFAACFGAPGPVREGRIKLTNLPWVLDSHQLASQLDIEHMFLINDLEANGYGIPELHPDQICELSEGDTSRVGNRGLVSAGTGLGEAILVWNGKMHVPMASEGGHVDFAPRTEVEMYFCTADITRKNHRVTSSVPTPFESGGGNSAAAAASSSNNSWPESGRTSCEGVISGWNAPCITWCRICALSLPAIRKYTLRAWLITGAVRVMRHAFFCGTRLATTSLIHSCSASVFGNKDAV